MAGGDSAFSSLWDALPSVAVVGGQALDTINTAVIAPVSCVMFTTLTIIASMIYVEGLRLTKCISDCYCTLWFCVCPGHFFFTRPRIWERVKPWNPLSVHNPKLEPKPEFQRSEIFW